jgi:hypothetical protein
MAQLEVVVRAAGDRSFTQRLDFGPICLEHPADAPPHVAGDTITVHRDSFVLDLPDLEGMDHVEVAWYEKDAEGTEPRRRVVVREPLDPSARETTGDVLWPEDFGDTELYLVYGNAAESDHRTNIVLVPDGYRYADKALLRSHADQMVAYFRARTPFREHDPFVNYVLVYAYSRESGTDQCDCAVIRDTAMATYFPSGDPTCGSSANRCLYYGSTCDTNSSCSPPRTPPAWTSPCTSSDTRSRAWRTSTPGRRRAGGSRARSTRPRTRAPAPGRSGSATSDRPSRGRSTTTRASTVRSGTAR